MSTKDIKTEARQKLPLNMHMAIAVYTIEYALLITLIALIVMSCVALNTASKAAAIVMICYGCVLLLFGFVFGGIINFSMVDFYLSSYRLKPYGIRGLGDALSRGGLVKVLALNAIRVSLGFLLLLLLIVPGVIYLIRTSMANNLLMANPKIKSTTALSASNKVMSGKTGSYFALMMSFFGWYVLGIFTLGLGFIFILPYINLTKVVYYKRVLQGDKTVYRFVPVPVAPPASVAPAAPDASVQQNAAATPEQEAQPKPVSQEPVSPMDTLADEDIRAINETMQDVVGPEAEVLEIPIMPVTVSKNNTAAKPVVPEPNINIPVTNPVEDSDLVEIVKPLSTQEMDDAQRARRRANDLFSTSQPREGSVHNYFGDIHKQRPDDFVTSESISIPGDNIVSDSQEEETQSVMDDKAFAEFLKTFDQDLSQPEPIKPTPPPVRTAPFVAPRPTARPSAPTTPQTPESRIEKARREREERLKNLNNK